MPKTVTRSVDLINEPHYAILTFGSTYVPGDERSRTNPGHGYPAHTDDYIKYEAYGDNEKEVWEMKIEFYTKSGHTFQAMRVIPAKVTSEVNVEINI